MAVADAEAKIVEALLIKAEQIGAGLGLPVANPNVAFTAPLETLSIGGKPVTRAKPYLSVQALLNTAELVGIAFDSGERYAGLLTFNVMWPAREGVVKATAIASRIVTALFPETTIVHGGLGIFIRELPRAAPAIPGTDWISVPVIARWTAEPV